MRTCITILGKANRLTDLLLGHDEGFAESALVVFVCVTALVEAINLIAKRRVGTLE